MYQTINIFSQTFYLSEFLVACLFVLAALVSFGAIIACICRIAALDKLRKMQEKAEPAKLSDLSTPSVSLSEQLAENVENEPTEQPEDPIEESVCEDNVEPAEEIVEIADEPVCEEAVEEQEEFFKEEPEEQPTENVVDEPAYEPIVEPVQQPIEEEAHKPDLHTEVIDGFVYFDAYRRSFLSKLIQSNAVIQGYYSEIKNKFLSYKKVHARMSFSCESFRLGRELKSKLAFRGRTLCMFVALNPDDYNFNIYHQRDFGDRKKYAEVPLMVKVRSNLGLKRALALIEILMADVPLDKKFVNVDYSFEYQTDEQLLEAGLIKKIRARRHIETLENETEEEAATRVITEIEEKQIEVDEEDNVELDIDEEEDIEEQEEISEEQPEEQPTENVIDESAYEPIVEPIVEPVEATEPIKLDLHAELVDGFVYFDAYRRSFLSKLIQSNAAIQGYYSEIKNKFLSYKKVHARMSFSCESFRLGRELKSKLAFRGRTLCMFVALSPDDYNFNIYHQRDFGDRKKYAEVPLMVRVRSNLGLKRALALIEILMADVPLDKKFVKVNYSFEYQTDEQLLEAGLIKKIRARRHIETLDNETEEEAATRVIAEIEEKQIDVDEDGYVDIDIDEDDNLPSFEESVTDEIAPIEAELPSELSSLPETEKKPEEETKPAVEEAEEKAKAIFVPTFEAKQTEEEEAIEEAPKGKTPASVDELPSELSSLPETEKKPEEDTKPAVEEAEEEANAIFVPTFEARQTEEEEAIEETPKDEKPASVDELPSELSSLPETERKPKTEKDVEKEPKAKPAPTFEARQTEEADAIEEAPKGEAPASVDELPSELTSLPETEKKPEEETKPEVEETEEEEKAIFVPTFEAKQTEEEEAIEETPKCEKPTSVDELPSELSSLPETERRPETETKPEVEKEEKAPKAKPIPTFEAKQTEEEEAIEEAPKGEKPTSVDELPSELSSLPETERKPKIEKDVEKEPKAKPAPIFEARQTEEEEAIEKAPRGEKPTSVDELPSELSSLPEDIERPTRTTRKPSQSEDDIAFESRPDTLPKGLYDEVPEEKKAPVKKKTEEAPKMVVPEGLTEEEKQRIAENEALLKELMEDEPMGDEEEKYDIVGICTDTSGFNAFEMKLYNAPNNIKYYYNEIKNTLLSYKKIKCKQSNAGDSFRQGNNLVARITYNGNKLRLHLALNPKDYSVNVYDHYSLINVNAYKDVPLTLEINKREKLVTAAKLIQDAMGNKFVVYLDKKREYVDYAAYYTKKQD